jgi:hypothetical protein
MPIRHGDILAKRASTWPTRPFLTQHNGTTLIVAHDVERVLSDIDTAPQEPARPRSPKDSFVFVVGMKGPDVRTEPQRFNGWSACNEFVGSERRICSVAAKSSTAPQRLSLLRCRNDGARELLCARRFCLVKRVPPGQIELVRSIYEHVGRDQL